MDTLAQISKSHIKSLRRHETVVERYALSLQAGIEASNSNLHDVIRVIRKQTHKMLRHAERLQTEWAAAAQLQNDLSGSTQEIHNVVKRSVQGDKPSKRIVDEGVKFHENSALDSTFAIKGLGKGQEMQNLTLMSRGDAKLESLGVSRDTTLEFEDVSAETRRRIQEAFERRKARRVDASGMTDEKAKDIRKRKRRSTESTNSNPNEQTIRKKLRVTHIALKDEVRTSVEAEGSAKVMRMRTKRAPEEERDMAMLPGGMESRSKKRKKQEAVLKSAA